MQRYTDGLCSNCRFSADCSLARDSLENIFFCEEYCVADASQKSRNVKAAPVSEPTGAPARTSRNTVLLQVLGLCSNCIHRKTCGFDKPDSGVWHCEEYA